MARAVVFLIILSFFVTALTFFGGNFWRMADIPQPTLFIFDSQASDRLTRLIASDPSGSSVIVTRIFHNKILSAGNTVFINLSRTLDLTFLFTITGESSSYQNVGKIWLLFPLEILPFLATLYVWIINGKMLWQKYESVVWYLAASLLLTAFISPVFYLPKFFPFLVMLRIFIYLSFWEWGKKLLSSR